MSAEVTLLGEGPRRMIRTLFALYGQGILISPHQALLIAAAIEASGPAPRVLIYGCGHDSAMWHALNPSGTTRFVENDAEWRRTVLEKSPQLEIAAIDYGDLTVAESLPVDAARLARYPVPDSLAAAWDVILIDAPKGFKPGHPGRALPIHWARRMAQPHTHVFIDDFNRDIEREHGMAFLQATGRDHLVIPRDHKDARNGKTMLWALPLA